MKKIFIFLGLMFVMLSGTYAQKDRQAIGFGLSYGTEIESAGLGIKYQYNITNPLRIEPSTLSKILCKWKQDSAVRLFLYLDSVFKNKHKLIHNQAPVMNRLCPFLLNLHK